MESSFIAHEMNSPCCVVGYSQQWCAPDESDTAERRGEGAGGRDNVRLFSATTQTRNHLPRGSLLLHCLVGF